MFSHPYRLGEQRNLSDRQGPHRPGFRPNHRAERRGRRSRALHDGRAPQQHGRVVPSSYRLGRPEGRGVLLLAFCRRASERIRAGVKAITTVAEAAQRIV